MRRGLLVLFSIGMASSLLLLSTQAFAIPAFARIYGYGCGVCHSAFPALNPAGESFRLSGYRQLEGVEVPPKVPPIKIGDRLELPGIIPVSLSLKAGYNFDETKNTAGDGSKNANTEAEFKGSQSSFNLNEFEILAGAPLGKHLSFFLDAEMAETEIRQFFDPEVRGKGANFKLEGPDVPALAFIGIHNILVPDLLNLKGGVIELPTAFSPEHRRLSFFPYLVYEATAYDVISHRGVDDLISVPGVSAEDLEKSEFRLSNTQVGVQLFGRATPSLHHVADFSLDYAVGVVNGNNRNTDNNKTKDVFGRLGGTYTIANTTFTVGGFGYYSGNTLDSLATINGAVPSYQFKDELWRVGPDLSITLNAPVYVNLFSQFLFAGDSNPTGFGKKAKWSGGFVEADAKPLDQLILYGRYDWIAGRRFDDTGVTINGATGTIGPVQPKLWDAVFGVQYFLYDNFKLMMEYRRGQKDLGPVTSDADHLKKTTENAVFTGFQMVF